MERTLTAALAQPEVNILLANSPSSVPFKVSITIGYQVPPVQTLNQLFVKVGSVENLSCFRHWKFTEVLIFLC